MRSAPTSTARTATWTSEAATTAWFLWSRFIDRQCPAVNAFAIECGNRRLSFLIRTHLDKSETLRALRFTIGDHLR